MIPVYLCIENFMNHAHSEIDFTGFRSALIVAKNKHNEYESNGVGKTTIFSAIEYVLFGEVPTSVLEKIVRHGQPKCLVTFDFLLNGELYRIERGRSRSGRSDVAIKQKNGAKWDRITGTRTPEVEKKILELVKINHKSFIHSIKFGQADVTGLASVDVNERRKILQGPLQLLDYQRLHKIALEKQREVKREIDKIDHSILGIGEPTIELQAVEQELTCCADELTSKEATVKRLTNTVVEKNGVLNELKKSLNSDDNEVHEKIAQLTKRSKDLKAQISTTNDRVQKNTSDIDSNAKSCAELLEKKRYLEEREQEFAKAPIRDLKDIAAAVTKVTEDELLGTKLLARSEAEYDHATKSIPDGNICSHCFQPITPEHRQKCREDAEKILAAKSEQINKIKSNLNRCRNKKAKLQQEYLDAQARVQQQNGLQSEKEQIISRLQLLDKHTVEARDRLADAIKELETARIEEEGVLSTLTNLKESASNSSAADVNKKIFDVVAEIRTNERSIENVRAEIASAQQRQGAALQKQKTVQEKILKLESLKTDLKLWRHKLNIHEYVVEAFNIGIPTFIIHSVLDELQLETNKWLLKLRPEIELQFDKSLDISYKVNGQPQDYDQLSVGQHVYIALSLKCGWSRVIQKKLGIDIRFLLWDEVDGPLDKAGVEALVEVTRKLQEEFKILVITHNDALKDKFTHAILVEGDGAKGAVSSVVTSW